MSLTEPEKKRYTRQMMLTGWGEEAQLKLRRSVVFIAGAGGLGSPVSFNLAVAGVGTLRLCDFDKPDLSNLNRQFLHDDSRLDMNKAESARLTLGKLNPHITLEAISAKIVDSNVDELVGDADIIVDCMDNIPTRFLLNACAVRKRIPFVHGSVWGMEGRVSFFHPPKSPCFQCFVKDSPPKEVFPVVGATPGITGSIQAMETLKYLTGIGETLAGRLLCCDFSDMRFTEYRIDRDPHCPVCSRGRGRE
ncbi:MAG TPA: HesA/MoeB/ThiF family protein [Elusimicrobiota bacterium]|nr:HesA/MoeB/ThiF family protein [Elusimicrobiota bacterium]